LHCGERKVTTSATKEVDMGKENGDMPKKTSEENIETVLNLTTLSSIGDKKAPLWAF